MVTLSGKEVAIKLMGEVERQTKELMLKGVIPTLATVRVGDSAQDISYEKALEKRFADNAKLVSFALPQDVSQDDFTKVIQKINSDDNIHGILVFKPLPKELDEKALSRCISQQKDIDCISEGNLSRIFSGNSFYAPSTALAVMEILQHYGIAVAGKKVVVVGRSLVLGKPLAMLLLAADATVTICHSKTQNLQEVTKTADILVSAAGAAGLITKEYVSKGQTIIDVGTNYVGAKLVGDVDFESISQIVNAATPVPFGVGAVTTAMLLTQLVKAAKQTLD